MIELVSILKRCGPEGQELVKKLDKGTTTRGGKSKGGMPMTLKEGMASDAKMDAATRKGKLKGPEGFSGYEELDCY